MRHIAILDFGSQYTHLIARRIRELEVLSKIYPTDISAKELGDDVIGIILSGGPQSVYAPDGLTIDRGILALGKPVLGLCYGHQLLAHLLGGEVKPGSVREYGRAQLAITRENPLLSGIVSPTTVWMSHGDTVMRVPEGFEAIGSTDDCPIAAMADVARQCYGLQFHPEVHHTESGKTILSHFVLDICGAERNWSIADLVDDIVARIQKQAAGKNVFLLVSGGVDSSVAFALLVKALGKERVYGLHIDTGFMRLNESDNVAESMARTGFGELHVHDASALFYERLAGVHDPEKKRKIIGQTFLDVKDQIAEKLGLNPDEWMLGQGTIYPDTIETGGTKHADTIKTHHNRVDAIQKLIAEGGVIEPIANFYKDEVRELGRLLGLHAKLIDRHPFPGPGLAIRVLCNNGKDTTISQPIIPALAPDTYAILPIKSVGVQGDNRTYAHPLAIWGETDWKKLDAIASRITNASREINRVLLALNPPVVGGSAHEAYLAPERVERLRAIDALIAEAIEQAGLYDDVWQFPAVLIPFGKDGHDSVVLRPVVSQEAMTAHFARLPWKLVETIRDRILSRGDTSHVFYDITNKPPGTIEWE